MDTKHKTKRKKPILLYALLVVLLIPSNFSSGNQPDKPTFPQPVIKNIEISVMNFYTEVATNFLMTDYYLETDYEEEIFMEDWMLDVNHKFWTTSYDETQAEEEIELENWMTDLSEWNLMY